MKSKTINIHFFLKSTYNVYTNDIQHTLNQFGRL